MMLNLKYLDYNATLVKKFLHPTYLLYKVTILERNVHFLPFV